MKKIIAALVIIIVIIGLIFGISKISNNSTVNNDNKKEQTTDLSKLKDSQYTSDNFSKVNIGDSKDNVEKILGLKGTELGKTSDGKYDVYSYPDKSKGSTYDMYYDNGKLAQVSVVLDN